MAKFLYLSHGRNKGDKTKRTSSTNFTVSIATEGVSKEIRIVSNQKDALLR